MKIYAVIDGEMRSAEVVAGAVCMQIGAREHDGGSPIEHIDWQARTYRRGMRPEQPFPASWYRMVDLEWCNA